MPKFTFEVETFAPANKTHDARMNARAFRAPAFITDEENADVFAIDVQNNINYFTIAKLYSDIRRVKSRMDKLEAGTASYEKAEDRLKLMESRLHDFNDLRSYGYEFVPGVASLFTWAVIRATRKDSDTDYQLTYQNELLSAIYDARDMSDANIETLRLSVLGFMRYHARNMERYGRVFDIRFTYDQAREVVHFANAMRYNWTKATITERGNNDADVVAHCILSALRKTFGWDYEDYKPVRTRETINTI